LHADADQVPPQALRNITALTTIRDHVLAPLLGAINTRRVVTKTTNTWTKVEHDYEAYEQTCKPSSPTSGSPREHRQSLGDGRRQAPSNASPYPASNFAKEQLLLLKLAIVIARLQLVAWGTTTEK